MALHTPTVTIDDLREFHAKHFPTTPLPEQYLHGVDADVSEGYYGEEDDGLGYYPDDEKRTLTDEQIAMFRHSEIQTILRERRRRREEGLPIDYSPTPPAIAQMPEGPIEPRQPILSTSPPSDVSTPMSMSSDDEQVQSKPAEKPVEKPQQKWTAISAKTKARNARNRKKNRKNYRARKKEEKKRKEQEEMEDEESDEWDPWHQANGPDVQKDHAVELDY